MCGFELYIVLLYTVVVISSPVLGQMAHLDNMSDIRAHQSIVKPQRTTI